jgi:hypothetical protein
VLVVAGTEPDSRPTSSGRVNAAMERKKKSLTLSGFPLASQAVLMVGATGFEPATTCTPSKCATRPRYAPNASSGNNTDCRWQRSQNRGWIARGFRVIWYDGGTEL